MGEKLPGCRAGSPPFEVTCTRLFIHENQLLLSLFDSFILRLLVLISRQRLLELLPLTLSL